MYYFHQAVMPQGMLSAIHNAVRILVMLYMWFNDLVSGLHGFQPGKCLQAFVVIDNSTLNG